jgi:hypothetical protein
VASAKKAMPKRKNTSGLTPTRPHVPGYGIPKAGKGMLPWSFVDERMAQARNYWVCTTRPDGRPHARPVDGVWVDATLCFGGGPKTRWMRNLARNPAVAVHLETPGEVVILEGTAERINDPKHPLVARVLEASYAKYPEYFSGPPPFSPFWVLRPSVAFAWTLSGFPKSATRWLLGKPHP